MIKQCRNITACVDSTIEEVCKKIQENETVPEYYADTVKALALLIEARALLNNNYSAGF